MTVDVNYYGLVAVDKRGNRVLFLDPNSLDITEAIEGLPSKPHELLIVEAQDKAYVPIYGDGAHGDNPHPNHLIAVIDLHSQELSKIIDIAPFKAPHTARLGDKGLLYCCCEDSGAVVVLDSANDHFVGAIRIPSLNVHRLATVSGTGTLITENEEDGTLSLVALEGTSGRVIKNIKAPGPLNGIAHSSGQPWAVATAKDKPAIYVLSTDELSLLRSIPLPGHTKPGQVVRYRDDGKVLAVIGDFEPVVSFYDADLNPLFAAETQAKPLDGAFSPDGKNFLVANEESGSVTVVDLQRRRAIAHKLVPVGCEVLGFFPLKN